MAVIVVFAGVAHAGKKRVVVLDFDGPKAEKFHDEVEKVVKKQNTIVPTDKWNGAAEELGANTLNKDNVKKVAKKLKIDAVVTGKVEKRDGEYFIKLKVRDGKTGAVVGGALEAAVENGKIASASKGDLSDAIAGLEAKGGGGGGDEAVAEDTKKDDKKDKKDKKSKKDEGGDEDKSKFSKKDDMERGGDKVGLDGKKDKKGKKDDEVAEDKPKKSKKDEGGEEDKPKKNKKDDEVAEDKPKKGKNKKSASTEDPPPETNTVEAPSGDKVASAASLVPAERAVDVALGMSFAARRLSFDTTLEGALIPPGYKQTVPVPGALIDATVYPLAFSHKAEGLTKNVGIAVMFDQVLLIKSKINNPDGSSTSLATTESHYSFGGAYRMPFGSMLLTATLSYSRQAFSIAHPAGVMVDMPSVQYGMIEPAVKLHYPFSDKLTIVGKLGAMLLLSTGDISLATEYGKTSGYGVDFEAGGEYMLTRTIFARATLRVDSIKMSFNGSGDKTKNRDGDVMTVDVTGARDTYFGAAATVGYLY